jgi:serine/threonine-protein kinase
LSEQKICPTCGSEYPLSERFCPRDGTALRSTGGGSDLVGSVVAERYHVVKKLGEGGMGQVYLAEHVKMGRKSALKVMNPGMNQDADAIARFNREAANASRLNHPNIAAIYDFGETSEGLIYLAMEFVEGQSLTALVEKSGTLSAPRAASIIHQAADALGVAHDAGIVHRDLKPDNIMIARGRDGGDLVKVVDFGIAKASSSDAQKVTKTGLVVGTPEYMSPEQLAGDKLDGRSDVYSLGLVAFNCLTGTLPFQSESAQEAMIMRLTDQPKTLAEMKPDTQWPEALQRVMDKALARDADLRYQTAPEFGRDIAKAVENMPIARSANEATQVIGAADSAATAVLPKTRVSTNDGPGATGGAGSTKKIDAATPASVAATAAPAKKSAMPMVIGAVVVLAGAVGGYVLMNRGGSAAPAQQVSAPNGPPTVAGAGDDRKNASDRTGSPATSAPAGGAQAPAKQVTPGTTVPRTEEKKHSPPPRASQRSIKSLRDAVLAENAGATEAQQVLAELEPIISASSGVELGEAYFVQAHAYGVINDKPKSCTAGRKSKPLLTDQGRLSVITALIEAQCP